MGTPAKRSKDVEEAILAGIRGGESLSKICANPKLPSQATVFAWLAADEARRAGREVAEGEVLFLDKYKIATRIRAAVMQEEILAISDDGRNDTYKDTQGKTVVDYDHIQRAKLRVDTRKWLMAKLEPSKYGDKPADISVATHVHSNVVSVETQREWQRRRLESLQRTGVIAQVTQVRTADT